MFRTVIITICLLITACSPSAQSTTLENTPIEVTSEDVSLVLVHKYNLGRTLTPISYHFATQSPFYGMISNKVGEENAKNIINKEVDNLVPKYQDRWDKYLASSIAEVLSADKLKSLLNKGSSSEYYAEFKEKEKEIHKLMDSKSYDLLIDLMTKAMIAANDKMVK
jgi:predicted house-cleaning noncanonical NTP pyrophosphatase (MazG superfamily)